VKEWSVPPLVQPGVELDEKSNKAPGGDGGTGGGNGAAGGEAMPCAQSTRT